MAISPDALKLTSNGTVGTGAEGSVKGARMLLSTKTASRIIADVYAVRKDYFDTHRAEVQKFVHGAAQPGGSDRAAGQQAVTAGEVSPAPRQIRRSAPGGFPGDRGC